MLGSVQAIESLCFLALRIWRDASTKEAQTLPLTTRSQIWSMTAIAVSRSSASAKRPSAPEAGGAIWLLRDGFVRQGMGASPFGVQQGRKPRLVAKVTDADD
jgi:hypothetical protein